MDLNNYATMDPVMLMSIVNMKLRDEFDSLEDLVRYYDIDTAVLCTRLEEAGFTYIEDANQFR
ncbi:hypothetical protein BZG06_03275 [Salinivibrio kushneri]|uniref:DUF4250 domain-containing protein n=1 Tax=Salinivibrio kushneri TaxID=1908198 RepID=A0AB36JWQ6_9GAMM|nr:MULTISPECIES: DUF4250 domain-containing protein [Salinivibrio]OOE36446.1 hypothetical protein BZG05_02960 [Salinivibrio kushneri]OOE39079.1 hypothetical protein BZG00_11790 [Salinivibrio kushneri]OOE44196.1 hypothetical protein BZG09_08605 [Salinivibrio kushneri]OOE47426.1 hypothetical protein BZG06_03275 [Salinivibrio kushneri]OOE67870.1 hypothetical protein BZG19_09540 [Salinivibrio kushneri]